MLSSNYHVIQGFGKALLDRAGNGFELKPISGYDWAAQKIVAHVKKGQKWLTNNNHLATFSKVQSKFPIHSVVIK